VALPEPEAAQTRQLAQPDGRDRGINHLDAVARIAVAATAPFGADVLERLARRHDVAALLTRPDAPRGRGRTLAAPPAKATAERLGIRVLQPERPEPGLDLGAPVAIVCAYGLLLPEDLLSERLWLNVHPSLLPRWRGAAPVERAILAGDGETGVTIHETVAALDAGPVAAQEAFPIGPEDDAGAVYARAAETAARLLDGILAAPDPARFVPQAEGGVTYAEKIAQADRMLDLARPADELVRRVRALSPHIGARAELHGRHVTVWRARVAPDGSFEPLEVQPDGGRRMPVDAWLRGLR
jgi:methionyl-tRNA formyltransferase